MKIGMIGVGRMGANRTERLLRGGHRVVFCDRNPEAIRQVAEKSAVGVGSLALLAEQLAPPRVVWLMVPAGDPVDQTIQSLIPHLKPGDGGNSYYKDTLRRAAMLKENGLYFVDAGTSGGIWGLTKGYSLMIGGDS